MRYTPCEYPRRRSRITASHPLRNRCSSSLKAACRPARQIGQTRIGEARLTITNTDPCPAGNCAPKASHMPKKRDVHCYSRKLLMDRSGDRRARSRNLPLLEEGHYRTAKLAVPARFFLALFHRKPPVWGIGTRQGAWRCNPLRTEPQRVSRSSSSPPKRCKCPTCLRYDDPRPTPDQEQARGRGRCPFPLCAFANGLDYSRLANIRDGDPATI
jgi:hypothetical protein